MGQTEVNRMGKINILPEALANQIAAGEVVERPASVVKELVENALDAQSTRVKISLKEGGLALIRVRDNGEGMSREDAEQAFLRHATSKIASRRDLFNIRSLGFRGEALPSIAAVAEVTCRTRPHGDDVGIQITLKAGETERVETVAMAQGTDMEVRHLFYNTPARLKHMKTIHTEVGHVADAVNRLALAYPEVAFELEHEGRTLLRTLGDGNVHHVIQAVYGQRVARTMLRVRAEHLDFALDGFISKPETTRASRHYISLIVNRRFVRSYPLAQAVVDAYRSLLTVNRMPIAVLHLTMDPKLVDVNVHPSKLEVRFSKERELKEWLTDVIRKRLDRECLAPQIEVSRVAPREKTEQVKLPFDQPVSVKEKAAIYDQLLRPLSDTRRLPENKNEKIMPPDKGSHSESVREARPRETPTGIDDGEQRNETVSDKRRLPELMPLAQVHGTYIVAQSENSLFLIDQHAAHERVYYEQFRRQLAGETGEKQQLLIPIHLELTAEEEETLREKKHLLTQMGIEPEPFGERSYLIRSHPVWFPDGEEEGLVREIVDWVLHRDCISLADLRDENTKQLACKAAVKANRPMSKGEMEAFLDQLRQADNPFTCPHGRPTLLELTSYELEKLFKRVM